MYKTTAQSRLQDFIVSQIFRQMTKSQLLNSLLLLRRIRESKTKTVLFEKKKNKSVSLATFLKSKVARKGLTKKLSLEHCEYNYIEDEITVQK